MNRKKHVPQIVAATMDQIAHKRQLCAQHTPKIMIHEADYAEATDSYQGWCRHCKEFTRENTEPDAENYDCPVCEKKSVVGAEQALLLGLIELKFNEDENSDEDTEEQE
jgi:Zn finger protein HypA/HybF involved in hydrogenase expression